MGWEPHRRLAATFRVCLLLIEVVYPPKRRGGRSLTPLATSERDIPMTHLQFLAAPNSTCRRRVLLCAVVAGCRLDWRPHRVICGVVARGKGYNPVLFAILGFFFSISTLVCRARPAPQEVAPPSR